MNLSDMIKAHTDAMRAGDEGYAVLLDDITAGDATRKKGERVHIMFKRPDGLYHAEHNDFAAALCREDFEWVTVTVKPMGAPLVKVEAL